MWAAMAHAPGTSPVLIVGSMALDDLELPSGNFKDVVGGAATFCSLATSLFAPAQIVGVVGRDFPENALANLRARGIDTSGVEVAEGRTFKWVGRYAQNLASRETLDTQLNVFADFAPKLPASYRNAKYVLLGNIHPQLQLDVLSQVEKPEFVAADTMNFWISGERKTLLQVLSKIDCLIINDEELRQLAEEHNIRRAAATVLKMGPKRLVVKRGEFGALLFDGPKPCFVPAYPLETELDPTGAGDSFAGALLGYLAKSGSTDVSALRRALVYATTVASFCVEGVGTARLGEVTTDMINARLAELRELATLEA
jgi:sugar/nucleoside kinase (ribokinase family)